MLPGDSREARTPEDGSGEDVAVRGDLAFVATTRNGFSTVDIADPATPRLVRTVTIPGNLYGVAVQGDYAYVSGADGLHVVDIRSPASAYLRSTVALGGTGVRATARLALARPGRVVRLR